MRNLLLILLIPFVSIYCVGQELNKHDKKFANTILENIENKISSGNYELALTYLRVNKDLFENPNLPKKLRKKYNKSIEEIKFKAAEFDENERKVQEFQKYFEEKNYVAAIKIFDIDINEHNSFLRTRELAKEMRERFKDIKSKCEDYKKRVYYIMIDLKMKNWESIFELYELAINNGEEYLTHEDIDKVLIIMGMITPKYGFNNYVDDTVISQNNQLLDSINKIEINTENAKFLIDRINRNKLSLYVDKEELSEFPKLELKFNTSLRDMEEKISSIKEFIAFENKKENETELEEKNYTSNIRVKKDNTNISNSNSSKFVLTHMLGKRLPKPAYFYIGSQKNWILDFNNGDKIKYTVISFRRDDHFKDIQAIDSFGDNVKISLSKNGSNEAVIEIKYNKGTVIYKGYYEK